MTARGGYVTKESDSLCGVKTAGFSIPMQTLLPREKNCPLVSSLSAKSVLAGEKLIATYLIST